MWKLQSTAKIISYIQTEDNRHALILDSTIFHPQGGGQPSDTGFISNPNFKFLVVDVRSKDGIVFHYGFFETSQAASASELENGQEVCLYVDGERRNLNSRLHSAGHLLDTCMRNVGLAYLEPGKGYHFPDGPFVEYKGTIPQNELESKRKELEVEANVLISNGGKVSAAVLPYEEASEKCGGSLPAYISKSSHPRIVQLGNNPGCPCGGTHVADIAEIGMLKVPQIRTKKGLTKVFYTIDS
ncbi:threonyl and alanyl tRNA synthetase second additional domain-containing protein [Tasmannia lanceolata]|uniref:threonyl and alanyl tRNA synthetase second additional domain-containing protein n=1 Tax=Tasmannia lanceolata TaxID=3420 RepID=UPI0040640401